MPLLTQSNVGGISVVPSNVNLRRNTTLATAGGGAVTHTSPNLFVNGLPQLQLWTQQDALSAGLSCTATLQFSVRQVGGTEEWLTLAQFTIPAAGVPGLLHSSCLAMPFGFNLRVVPAGRRMSPWTMSSPPSGLDRRQL